ncbi:MAG: Ig-like domain-containing protein, partial [Nanobdellota archaeon]
MGNTKQLVVGLFILIGLLSGVAVVDAQHDRTTSWLDGQPVIYEFSDQVEEGMFSFWIGAISNNSVVTIRAEASEGLVLNEAGELITGNWTSYIENNHSALWTGDTLRVQQDELFNALLFSLSTTAQEVDSDTNYTLNIETKDSENDIVQTPLTYTVLNDNIAPRTDAISYVGGSQYDIVKKGDYTYTLNVSGIYDDESGYDRSTAYHEYDNDGEPLDDDINLGVDKTFYNSSFLFDLHMNSTNDYLGYRVDIFDKANNTKIISGKVFLDEFAPTISTVVPNVTTTDTLDFTLDINDDSFNATNRFGANVTCMLELYNENNSTNDTRIVDSQGSYVHAMDVSSIPDGYYSWTINCSDQAQRYTMSNSTNQILIDRQPPKINLTTPTTVSDNETITFIIEDETSDVDSVENNNSLNATTTHLTNKTQYNISTSQLDYGENDIQLIANDTVGNTIDKTFIITMDNVSPEVDMNTTYPQDGNYTTGNMTINVTDEYSNVTCKLTLKNNTGDVVLTNHSFQPEESFNPTTNLSDGNYSWQANCQDEIGNELIIGWYSFFKDATAPDITMHNPEERKNTDGINVTFNFTAVDELSGVKECSITFNGTTESVSLSNTSIIKSFSERSEGYLWNVTCSDELSNTITSPTRTVFYDRTLPTLSMIHSTNETSNSAIVTLETSEPVNATLLFNSTNKDNYVTFETFSDNHTRQINGLDSSSRYKLSMVITDRAGNQVNLDEEEVNLTVETT